VTCSCFESHSAGTIKELNLHGGVPNNQSWIARIGHNVRPPRLTPTPGGTSAPGHLGASVLPSAFRDNVGSHDVHSYGARSRGLPTRCLRFVIAVTCDHARLASRLLASFAGRGWLPAGFLRKVSELFTSHPPCPGLACRTTKFAPEPLNLPKILQLGTEIILLKQNHPHSD
jgi:hypothetical protein